MRSIIITLALLACGCSFAPSVVAQEPGVEVGVAVEDAAAKLGAQILERDKRKLAVVGFSDINGFESALGDFLAEELVAALFSQGDFDVLERREMQRIQEEKSQYAKDSFRDADFKALGAMWGVDVIVTGTLTDLGGNVRWNARALEITTGRVFAATSKTIAKTDGISNLLARQSSRAIAPRSPVEGAVTQSASVQFQNRWISVVPKTVLVSPNRKQVRIAAELQNISGRPISVLMALSFPNLATTNTADDVDPPQLTGVNWSAGDKERIRAYASGEIAVSVAPGERLPIVWVINAARGGALSGDQLSIRSSMALASSGSSDLFEIRLNGINIG